MTKELFMKYLEILRSQMSNDKIIYAPTYTGDEIEDKAKEINITLQYIPPGCTDELEPLDIRIFGSVKNIAKNKTLQFIHRNQLKPIGYKKAIQILMESWDQISTPSIMEAWSVYED